MTMPNWQAQGTSSATVGSTGNTTPTWPTHATGDLGICAAENNSAAPAIPSPFVDLPLTPTPTSGFNTVLSLASRRAASAAEGTPTIPDPGNHCYAVINTFRNVHQRYPFHRVIAQPNVASATARWPGFETQVDDTFIALFAAWPADTTGPVMSSPVNSSLANLTKRTDEGTDDGDGGGVSLVTGEKAGAGTVDPTSASLSPSTAAITVLVALAPIADIPITVAVEVDGVPHASGDGVVFLYDTSQPQASYLVLDAATETTEYVDGLDGSGEADFVVPYNDHTYVAFYTNDSGGLSGVSGPIVYSGGFPTATIEISTGGGGGLTPPRVGSPFIR